MNKQRLAILIVAGLGALATFMPWVKMPIVGSVNGTAGDGWITFGLFAVSIIISLLGDRTKPIKGGLLYAAIVPALLAAALGISKILDFKSKTADMDDNPFASMIQAAVTVEFGLYLVVAAGLALPIAALVVKGKETIQ